MNVLLISDSFITIEALERLLNTVDYVNNIIIRNSAADVTIEDMSDINLVFIEIEGEVSKELEFIRYIKYYLKGIKVIVLDRNKCCKVMRTCIGYSVESYFVTIKDKDDFIYNLNKVIKGKNVYEFDETNQLIDNNFDIDSLSKREKSVLDEVLLGLNNKEIAEKLYISEATVKKHVSNILSKLSLRNRQEIIVKLKNYL